MIRKCKRCGREFETNRRDVYCSFNCKKHYINEQAAMKRRLVKVNEIDLSKTLCHQCEHCETLFYTRRTRNGKWKAQTKVDGVQVYAGVHDTELKAAHAYYKKLEELNVDINKESKAYKLYKSMMH